MAVYCRVGFITVTGGLIANRPGLALNPNMYETMFAFKAITARPSSGRDLSIRH